MTRRAIKNELKSYMLQELELKCRIPSLREIEDWLEHNYGLGDEAFEFLSSIIGGK